MKMQWGGARETNDYFFFGLSCCKLELQLKAHLNLNFSLCKIYVIYLKD